VHSKVFFDLSRIDQSRIEIGKEEIRRWNPQRYEFEQLDGVFALLPEEGIIIGFKDVRSDEFWVRGHLPQRPLLPGVLMIEAAAQLCSVFQWRVMPPKGFFGFAGIDRVKFRASVAPGERLILIGKKTEMNPRRSTFDVQGVVGEKLVFEGTISGVAIPAVDLRP
jgi:3-hydroxyacyl-[acyl-carrier-protein] dehydratase